MPPCLGRRRTCLGLAAAFAGVRPALAEPPLRIVSLDDGLSQTLVALGHPPVATVSRQDWTTWVIEPPLPDSVQNLGSDQDLNAELLVGLKPDLIVLAPYLDAWLPTLQRIAPCERLAIYEPGGDPPLRRAERATRRLADILGDVAAGEALVATTQEQFAVDKVRLATVPARPLLLVNFMDGRHVRVYGAKSLWQDVLDRLGLANAWQRPTTYWGFSTEGIEALAAFPDATLVASAPIPPDTLPTLARSPLWLNLPFVRERRVLTLPPALMFGALPAARRFSRLLTAGLVEAQNAARP